MTLDKFNEIIDDAMSEIAHGMIVNASGARGAQLKSQLRAELNFLIELDSAARSVGADIFAGVKA